MCLGALSAPHAEANVGATLTRYEENGEIFYATGWSSSDSCAKFWDCQGGKPFKVTHNNTKKFVCSEFGGTGLDGTTGGLILIYDSSQTNS